MLGSRPPNPETQRVVKFALVGVTNTLVALASYAIFLAIGVNYAAAGALGWSLGLLNGYTWNRLWTFDQASHRMSLLLRYSAVGALGLILNMALLVLLIGALDMDRLIAEILALPITVLITFLINRRWVFGHHLREVAARSSSPSR